MDFLKNFCCELFDFVFYFIGRHPYHYLAVLISICVITVIVALLVEIPLPI